jgi:nascent polypeptide-associated complex subunit alpha
MKRMNPREMKRMMQKMGMGMEELSGVFKVTLHMKGKNLIIPDPQITVMKVSGQTIYQVVGEATEESPEELETKIDISDDDAQLVSAQTGSSLEAARKALESTKGDLAQAIMLLSAKG